MKKIIAMILALMLALSLAACGETNNTDGDPDSAGNTVSLEGYPTDINEWTTDDFVNYFTEAGVFTDSEALYISGTDVWAGTALSGNVFYADSTGLCSINIYLFDEDNPAADVPAFLSYVRENHTFDESLYLQPVDHLVGTVAFTYSPTTDEEIFEAMDAAYNALVEGLGVTPDF